MIRKYWSQLYTEKESIKTNINKIENKSQIKYTNSSINKEFIKTNKELTEDIKKEKFRETLQSLKLNVARRIDEILNKHIKRNSNILKNLVKEILNTILETNITLSEQKTNRIFMIHKKKDTNNSANY